MVSKAISETEEICKNMIKAAAVMDEPVAYITEQAGLIFPQSSEPLAMAEMEFNEAQKEHGRLSKELEELRCERRKYPRRTYSEPTQEEDKDGE